MEITCEWGVFLFAFMQKIPLHSLIIIYAGFYLGVFEWVRLTFHCSTIGGFIFYIVWFFGVSNKFCLYGSSFLFSATELEYFR